MSSGKTSQPCSFRAPGVGPVLSGGPPGHFDPGPVTVLSLCQALALSWGVTMEVAWAGQWGGADVDVLGSGGAGSGT